MTDKSCPPLSAATLVRSAAIRTDWGPIGIELLVYPDTRRIRLSMPERLPRDFRKAVEYAAELVIKSRGRTPETVEVIEALVREAMDLPKDGTFDRDLDREFDEAAAKKKAQGL